MIQVSTDIKTRIIDKVVRVLFKNHTHPERKKLVEGRDRINFACPYCGDSTTNTRKKRGNIYWDDLYFHCYNCSSHKTLDSFLEDFGFNFEGEERISILNIIKENRKEYSLGESLDFYLFEKINKLALSFDEISLAFNVYPINELTYRAYPYLKSRFLHNKLDNFAYDPRKKELYIFNLNQEDKIIGFQTRDLEGTGPKYKTWNIQRIYDRIGKTLDSDGEELDNLNKISMLFNALRTDFSRTFTIFEGPIDSMFMNNTIGLTGVKKQIVEFNEIPTARYFFDNDFEGKSRMIEKLKSNQTVFMWDKFCKDFKISPKYVKDLNDLVKYEFKEKTGCFSELNKYFTNNPLDIVYV